MSFLTSKKIFNIASLFLEILKCEGVTAMNSETAENILPILRQTYKSLDIRAVLAKSKNDELWHSIFLMVRLTNEHTDRVKEKQNRKKLCDINKERFKKCKRFGLANNRILNWSF